MPRLQAPLWAQDKAQELRSIYGGYMNVEDVKRELGLKDRRAVEKFLNGVQYVRINNRRRYAVLDVAKTLYKGVGV